ncbi:toxin-antitoxin system YwqK family antitoxin [Planctellipticum variicoloris]|uniref:toxin-antitoxin system YwqK family antitoxin n=1 Tax=Planctellipticum variicoloris TaxID=3064265 RepID=UPI003013DBFB|nr:hypothetical protein SH412_001810 [Planctomycetaceae bacterium SH412]
MPVDWDDLVSEIDSTYSHEGKPFQGQAVVRRENGSIESEVSFENGVKSGPFVDYYPNGRIECRGAMNGNVYDGEIEYLNEDGTLNKSETYDLGICTKRKVFKDGETVAEWSLPDDDPVRGLIAARRRRS